MIDCHAHAYPALGERFDRALDRLDPDAGFIVRDAIEDLRGAAGLFSRRVRALVDRVPAPRPLSIERVAQWSKKLPGPVREGMEAAVALGLLPQIAVAGNLDRLLASMDAAGIERAVLIASRPLATNTWLLQEAWPRARSRLVPVAMVPDLPADASERQWLDAFEELAKLGARGFKIHPNQDGFDAGHAAYRAMFQVAERRRQFVILHTGHFRVPGMRRAGPVDPAEFESLIAEHPGVAVCLAHMNRERPEGAWDLMRRHEHVFTDTSWQPEESVRTALGQVGARRILLGSDWPLLNDGLQSNAVDILRRAASETDFERVASYTPRVFLGEA